MDSYTLDHLADSTVWGDLPVKIAAERGATAIALAYLAEADARKLYVPHGHPSLYSYCVRELRYTEDEACKRIRVARLARLYPAIFPAFADGRLSLTVLVLLAPHLTPENANELLAAAANRSRSEVECLIAERFPKLDVPTLISPIGVPAAPSEPASAVSTASPPQSSAPGRIEEPLETVRIKPLAPQRFAFQTTLDQETLDLLSHVQALLGPRVPRKDVSRVLRMALQCFARQLEKRKFAATAPRSPKPARGRHIPPHVKREVWQRDGGQCTFRSEAGHRCPARERLEFDHALEYARGGNSTVQNLRLRCRAHNQYAAEQTFGAGFMERKRREAQAAAESDVIPWLRKLGFRLDQARFAAAHCEGLAGASLEERVRHALSVLAPRARTRSA